MVTRTFEVKHFTMGREEPLSLEEELAVWRDWVGPWPPPGDPPAPEPDKMYWRIVPDFTDSTVRLERAAHEWDFDRPAGAGIVVMYRSPKTEAAFEALARSGGDLEMGDTLIKIAPPRRAF